jgi:CHAT domain-containing protein
MIKMVSGIDLRKFLNFTFIFLLLNFNSSYSETKQKPWIGIEFRNITEEFIKYNKLDSKTPKNIIVTGVVKNSAADEAKIVPGDVVIAIDNIVIKTSQDLVDILKKKYVGDIIFVKVYRKGNTIVKKVKLKNYPDSGFKPSWVNGSKLLKDPPQKSYTLENSVFGLSSGILYPDFFSKKILKKYNHDNLTVTCVTNDEKNKLKLYDQIVSINGETPSKAFPLKPNQKLRVKIIRNGKIIKKTIVTTENKLFKLRHNCTPEYADFDCIIDTQNALSIPRSDKNDNSLSNKRVLAFKKALDCFHSNEVSVVPFHNIFKKEGRNLKFDAYGDYLAALQYQYPEGSTNEQKNLPEIRRVLELAKKDIIEFDKFQQMHPNHNMGEAYNRIIDQITSTTTFAGSMYTGEFLSTKDDLIKIDKDIVKITKTILEKLIKDKSYNNFETIKYLDRKRPFLVKSNEREYLIKHYSKAINQIDFTKSENQKYFYDYYFDLANLYNDVNDNDKGIQILEQGLAFAKKNYDNLIFANAYGRILGIKYALEIFYGGKNQDISNKKDKENIKLLTDHLNYLDSLTTEQKSKMFEIDNTYYLDILRSLNMTSLSIVDSNELRTYWPMKAYEYIKNHKNHDFIFSYPGVLDSLIQSSLIEDDEKIFNLAKNEFKILLADSANNKKKLYSIFNYSASILQNFDMYNLHSDSDQLISFIDQTFDLDNMQVGIEKDIVSMILVAKGKSLIRNGKIQEAKLVYEDLYLKNEIEKAMQTQKMNSVQSMILRKVVPALFEIYATENNTDKMNSFTNTFFYKNTSDIKKRDLKDIERVLSLDALKIYKSLLIYFDNSKNKKKFKLVNNHIKRNSREIINHIKNNSYELTIQTANSKISIINELAQIAEILFNNDFTEDGEEILNELYPLVINDFNEKAARALWKPNIQDEIISNIYLNIAEKKLMNKKSFLQKAFDIAQAGKNTYSTRDLSRAISRKKIVDPENLVAKYQQLNRELSVNLRNRQFRAKEKTVKDGTSAQLINRNRELQKEITILYDQINEKIPSYFKLTKIQTTDINDIQRLLKKDQILLDYYFFKNDLKVILISKDYFKIVSNNSNSKIINEINEDIRETLIPENNIIKPFAVNKSYQLNEQTFLFFNKIIKDYKNIIVIPDGPLNSMPLHALAYAKNNDCLDCRNVKFNLDHHTFNYYPSVESFSNIDIVNEEFKKISLNTSNKMINNISEETIDVIKQPTLLKQFKKLKGKVLKKDKSKISKSKSIVNTENFYLGIGDPDLYSKIQVKKIDPSKKITMLRSLFDKDQISSKSIKEIYGPVDGSAEEINQVAEYLSPLKSKILLRENAKESNLKELDLSSYKIIHFATHGEVSGAITGINEPFLVLSPPNKSSTEDGLLTMSEIMLLDTNANLIVLSACNTASGDEAGSEGFSGLTKSFFMSGSKSILVSNWYVETYSAKELVINLFKNLKDNTNFSISDGLNLTMSKLKNEKEQSHPLFWAPFVVVGKNQQLFF